MSTMDIDITSSTNDGHSLDEPCSKTILKTPDSPASPSYNGRQNQVNTVLLAGVPIVSLYIDGKERLCLAQISNTLLKRFSYNEIHNRRVALGITCVQCTPVQLEILRRAGAMPISSRRCGMITKREAERLVKSFLEDNRPPKLPDNYHFSVQHNCGWGCKGKFEPSRYNSSRAKCIKCNFCNLYFSPNKFIFHFHRAPDSKYNHPDAANFNSWRRHLHLCPGSDSDDIMHAWEDVKAMFNGGSRKRMTSSPPFPERLSSSTSEPKRPKISIEADVPKQSFSNQYQGYPMFSMPNKTYPFPALTTPNPLALQYQMGKTDVQEAKNQMMAMNSWRGPPDFIMPSYDLLWANQFNVRTGGLSGFRPNFFSSSSPVKDLSLPAVDRRSPSDTANSSDDDEASCSLKIPMENMSRTENQRLSAFRPFLKSRNEDRDSNGDGDNGEDIDEENDVDYDVSGVENEDLDVDIEDNEDCALDKGSVQGDGISVSENRLYSPDTSGTDKERQEKPPSCEHSGYKHEEDDDKEDCEEVKTTEKIVEISDDTKEHTDRKEIRDLNSNMEPFANQNDITRLSKEELQTMLRHEMDVRRRVERDINKIKDSLQDQVCKEKSQRDEIARQLQAMKDALCNELEQERKIRFSMQQKLKEAHDALHNFSCKMLANRQCAECAFKEATASIPR